MMVIVPRRAAAGQSKNQPFRGLSHLAAGFQAEGS